MNLLFSTAATRRLVAAISILSAAAASADRARAADPSPPASAAVAALTRDLAPYQNLRTISVDFVCEKKLVDLDTPLQSAGRWWVEPDPRDDDKSPAMRFSTESPYASELILVNKRAYAISQHESKWSSTGQSSHPGLTAVMLDLSDLLAGRTDRLEDLFTITQDTSAPPPPSLEKSAPPADIFILTPSNKNLAAAVSQVTVAIAHPPAGDTTAVPPLLYAQITTTQGDITRYWFSHAKLNAPLPADLFKPRGRTPAGKAATEPPAPTPHG